MEDSISSDAFLKNGREFDSSAGEKSKECLL